MKYMGSKARIASSILPLILQNREDGQWYVEPFGGGANVIDKVKGRRIYSDINPFLVSCFRGLTSGWVPPCEISRELYNDLRNKFNSNNFAISDMALIGYVGINGSYGGRWFDGGYAGVTSTREGNKRNYPLEAYKNVMAQIPSLEGVEFHCSNYKDLEIPPSSVIYCDPPYRGTKEYTFAKGSGFDSLEFWDWCRVKSLEGHQVFISEYEAPEDFICIWEKKVSSSLRANSKISGAKSSTEKLFTYKLQPEQAA